LAREHIALLLAFFLVGALPGCSTAPKPPDRAGAADTATIYVVRRGWHTDIVLPASELSGRLTQLERIFPDARYVSFGFGERNYVLARRTTFADMLLALWPGPGLMLVTGLWGTPSEAFGASHVVTLRVSETGRDALIRFISFFFAAGPHGVLRVAAPGPYSGSLFFVSPGTYSAVFTCNTWVADALHRAGLPVTAAGVLFAAQVIGQAREVGADQSHQIAHTWPGPAPRQRAEN
jgi:uncharacterized protein (TIGR02117 family)